MSVNIPDPQALTPWVACVKHLKAALSTRRIRMHMEQGHSEDAFAGTTDCRLLVGQCFGQGHRCPQPVVIGSKNPKYIQYGEDLTNRFQFVEIHSVSSVAGNGFVKDP